MDQVNEIWENQRFYGIGWCAASALFVSQLHIGNMMHVNMHSCSRLVIRNPSHLPLLRDPHPLRASFSLSSARVLGYRQSPGLLERPSISDAEGYPVAVDKRPTEEEPLGWRLVVSPATDIEGWQYASVFKWVFCLSFHTRPLSTGCSLASALRRNSVPCTAEGSLSIAGYWTEHFVSDLLQQQSPLGG